MKAEALAKLVRRIGALPAGRYEVIITITESGPSDWSVLASGKVERP